MHLGCSFYKSSVLSVQHGVIPSCLVFQSKEKIYYMEQSVQKAQTLERQMLEMSQWMSDVTEHLQSRLDADVLAGDVPEEYEVCVGSSDIHRHGVHSLIVWVDNLPLLRN